MKIFFYLLLLVVIILGVSFATLNAQEVSVNYYFDVATLPLCLLLAITLALGGVLGVLVSMGLFIKLKAKHYHCKHRLKVVEKELENLRSLPIKDTH